jgi:uncharacterized protein YdaU (DUF1376 family)
MHYYSFHVSDYIHDTAHLSNEEDLAFRRLLDLYYTQEKPIPNNTHEVARRIRMAKNIGAVQTVLEEFFMFNMQNNEWYHKRCDETIAAYQAKAERNRIVGKLGGRPKLNPQETQSVTKNNPNQEPRTNNHKPIVKATKGSRLSADFALPDEWVGFCQQHRPDLNPAVVFDGFKDYWVAKTGSAATKLDWTATWRNWVRNQRQEKPIFADIARVTVPSKPERDPALVKLDEDSKKVVPPNPEILAKLKLLRGVN